MPLLVNVPAEAKFTASPPKPPVPAPAAVPPVPPVMSEAVLLKRFAPLVRVKAMPAFSPVLAVLPVIVLLTLPSPSCRVPLSTEMMELLLVLVMFPEKRRTKEPVGSKTREAALVTFPRIDPPAPIESVPALITVPPV
jgi:hypothetical protein